MAKAGFSGPIEKFPNPRTIEFNGKYVNLSALARELDVTPSMLSLVFSGKRNPSLKVALGLASLLRMKMDDLVKALSLRSNSLRQYRRPAA